MLAAVAGRLGEPELTIRAADENVPMLGAVLSYGSIVAPLQSVWLAAAAREPGRLTSRFGVAVAALKNVGGGVEIDAGIAERFDLAVVAEGGVFTTATRAALVADARPALRHDYRQTAWVGRPLRRADRPRRASPSSASRGTAGRAAAAARRPRRPGVVLDSADDR
ncbi:MAG: hypothetical protein WKG52_11475 [Variovorax sp.]